VAPSSSDSPLKKKPGKRRAFFWSLFNAVVFGAGLYDLALADAAL
jgi:hypothetical protein